MATFTPDFRTASQTVHFEHQALSHELGQLQAALDELVCYSETYANLASAEQVGHCGRHLADLLPVHFRREESTVLATVAQVSAELAEFAREMRRQHQELLRRLEGFRGAVDSLRARRNLGDAICKVKEEGKQLVRELLAHVALEEEQLGGFLG